MSGGNGYRDGIVAQTFYGLEKVLGDELRRLGAKNVRPMSRAVAFSGTRETVYRANLHLRTATRVLVPLFRFRARNDHELYDAVRAFAWERHLTTGMTLAVNCVARSERFTHSKFAALRLKDAVVDRFRADTGSRPSVNVEAPDLRIHMYIYDADVSVSLDSSGDSLNRRGYRRVTGPAPLNEVTAAGLVLLSGWDGKRPFCDPLCGSGTIPVEAALIARNSAPGLLRKRFGFMGWRDFDEALWDRVVGRALDAENEAMPDIRASDIDPACARAAGVNAAAAGVDDVIAVTETPFTGTVPAAGPGTLVTNPPYDERIKVDDITKLYGDLGRTLKRNYKKYDAWIISSRRDALRALGMRPAAKVRLYNGAMECAFQKYSVY